MYLTYVIRNVLMGIPRIMFNVLVSSVLGTEQCTAAKRLCLFATLLLPVPKRNVYVQVCVCGRVLVSLISLLRKSTRSLFRLLPCHPRLCTLGRKTPIGIEPQVITPNPRWRAS